MQVKKKQLELNMEQQQIGSKSGKEYIKAVYCHLIYIECGRIDAFELWFWRSLLRVPWTARRSNRSFLKEMNREYSLKELILKTEALIFWPSDAKN